MKTEIGTTDTNNSGREYQFQYDGIKTSTFTSPTIEELSEIHGDNIVYETGEGILMEDGEIGTQDPNQFYKRVQRQNISHLKRMSSRVT